MTTASARAEGDSDRGSAAASMLWAAGGAILVFLLCLVALNTAGSPPFYATELRFIDMLGLNDRTIARRVVGAP